MSAETEIDPACSEAGEAAAATLADEVLEQIGTPIVVLDLDGRILFFNAACRALTGYECAEAVGRRVWDFLLLPEETGAVRGIFNETRACEQPTHLINYWLTKQGKKRLLKWSNTRARLPSGREVHILATGIDITDVAVVENALADSEAQLRSLINTSPESIITIDAKGIVRGFSPAAQATFGYSAEDVIGENIRMLMAEPHASEHDVYIKRYLDTGEARIIGSKRVTSALRKDGTVFPIRLSVGEFHQHGELYFVGFIEDLSGEEEARRRLREVREELDRYSRVSALGEMATGIAHELNQPLTAAATSAEAADLMLEREGRDRGDQVRAEVERGLNEIHRAAEIIRNIREFIRKGRPALRTRDVNVLVEEALTFVLSGSAPEALETRLRLAPDLPQVELDRVQIQQVIVNLIRNALEVMAGSSPATLEVSTDLDGPDVKIRVADTGSGIDPAMEGRLFEPFATNKRDGLGLGLAIARTIVKGHGGELTAGPNRPRGMVFTVRLPLRQDTGT